MCMMHSHESHGEQSNGNGQNWLFSRTGIATLVAVSVLGFLIYEGHGAHLLGFLPYLLILSCPLMHIFMHGGHGGHHHHDEEREDETKPAQQPNQQADNNNKPQHQHKHGGC